MSRFRRVLGRYRAGSDATPEELVRIRARLARSHTTVRVCRRVLSPLATVEPGEIARVHARLTTSLAAPRRRPLRLHAPIVGTAALLAALLLRLLLPAAPTPLGQTLDAPTLRTDALTADVTLAYQGSGSVSGTDRAPAITWDDGTLQVEVEPGRGIALGVETPEARVAVIGTVFTVKRDALGTDVSVARGHVSVSCARGESADLLAGDHLLCLPARPAGLLGRARALAEAGADGETVLATLDLGLADAEAGPVRDELAALRVVTLARLGRADALAAADALLATGGGPRRAAVARLAAQLALRAGGCAAARRYLDAIPADERLENDDAARGACDPPTETP